METIEKNMEVFNTYLKENAIQFETEKIKEFHYKLEGNSKDNLRDSIYLGQLFEKVKAIFLSPESKQERKNLGLKIGVKYFLEQNFLLSEGYINKLIQGFNNKEKLDDYLKNGHIGKSISVENFLTYCNPKKEKETETTEAETTEAETTKTDFDTLIDDIENASNYTEEAAFGGITLTISKASREDILKAIEYLQNKVN